MKRNLLGIMQGRLSPPAGGRIQSFPKDTWQSEFWRAKECGFDVIDWIFDADSWEDNPLCSIEGRQEIQRLTSSADVRVVSVCADYFLDLPLLRVGENVRAERMEVLKFLIEQSGLLGVKYAELPFLDGSAIQTQDEMHIVQRCIRESLPVAERYDVTFALETSLSPENVKNLMESLNHSHAAVCYDIGNSASLGYRTEEEIHSYGKWIATVHVKDRLRGGWTVALGTGNADFNATFRSLSDIDYRGPYILQAARDGDEVEVTKKNLEYVRSYLT
jgi:L-ribulose-5-phosphate 3-epimerase